MIGKGAFIASKAFAKKHYTGAVKAIKELKGPLTKYGSKVEKHIKKHPLKYTAGAAGVTGFGLAKSHSAQEKRLKTYFGKLPKSDPRYKALKKKGFV